MADAEAPGPPGISLLPGERVTARLTANSIYDGRGFEGYLYLTSQRIIHRPWRAALTRGAKAFALPLAEVAGADVAPRGTHWRDGSLRRRLRVTMKSGHTELFVVWRAGKAAELVERMRKAASAG
jgi:hypothetical protein